MIINGNALQIPLADKTAQCCITSPPYWGLRDYGVDGQLGLEATPEKYVDNMVRVFREVRRVLRDDGVLWLNLGDSYCSIGHKKSHSGFGTTGLAGGKAQDNTPTRRENNASSLGLKHKDLVGIPWRVAFALQANGWYLRSDIIWHKPNCMPESVTDRPTKAHEYVFLLSKSARYFYDADAVREQSARPDLLNKKRNVYAPKWNGDGGREFERRQGVEYCNPAGRNRRTVWTIPTRPYSGAHFATFPPKLVEPMILAGTSARGECPVCGLGWRRVVNKSRTFESGSGKAGNMPKGKHSAGLQGGGETLDIRLGPVVRTTTTGWQPQCTHDAEPTPQLVLDPFGGTCTVGQVAIKHRRRFVGLELNGDYIELARKRTSGVQVALL